MKGTKHEQSSYLESIIEGSLQTTIKKRVKTSRKIRRAVSTFTSPNRGNISDLQQEIS